MRRSSRIVLVCLAVFAITVAIAIVGVKTWLAYGHVDVVTKPRTGTSITADQKVADFDYLRTILQENFSYFAVKKRDRGNRMAGPVVRVRSTPARDAGRRLVLP